MSDSFFEIREQYTLLKVHATTKASKNAITGVRNGTLMISVTAVPENGKANAAIIKILSKSLKCAKSKIELISGTTNRNKLFQIKGIFDLNKLIDEKI